MANTWSMRHRSDYEHEQLAGFDRCSFVASNTSDRYAGPPPQARRRGRRATGMSSIYSGIQDPSMRRNRIGPSEYHVPMNYFIEVSTDGQQRQYSTARPAKKRRVLATSLAEEQEDFPLAEASFSPAEEDESRYNLPAMSMLDTSGNFLGDMGGSKHKRYDSLVCVVSSIHACSSSKNRMIL